MIKKITEYINSLGRFYTTKEIIENAVWYHMATLYGLIRAQIEINGEKKNLNYYGISIAQSSAGKSFSYEKVVKTFNIDPEMYYDVIAESYSKLNPEQITVGNDQDLKSFIPEGFNTNIEGTNEGLYLRAFSISMSDKGSINILNEEILDIIENSTMNRLKEMYDGVFNAKVIKSEINPTIDDIFTNMLVFGSPIGIKKSKSIYDAFNKALGSGMYRRSFIYYYEPTSIVLKKDKSKVEKPDLSFIKKNIGDILREDISLVMKFNANAESLLEHIQEEIVDFMNDNLEDDRYAAELGSYDKICKLAGLHALLNQKEIIGVKDVRYAYDFYLRCRSTVPALFCTEPQHERFYKIIKKNSGITKSEMMTKDVFDQKTFVDDIAMVKELAYLNNERLKIQGSSIKKYSIEPLESTSLQKLIVSVSTDGKLEKSTLFNAYEIPFDGNSMALSSLVKAKPDAAQCFCLVHFEKNKRDLKSIIEGQNLIAFDIDDGFSLKDAVEMFKNFTSIIYTTRNHRKEKNGKIVDRFRVILPTKHMFYVDNERHGAMLENIAEAFEIPMYDSSVRDQSRLWFCNPDAEVFINECDLLDVIAYIPETVTREKVLKNKHVEKVEFGEDEIGKRMYGMTKWFLSNTYSGNRNSNLFKYMMFVYDLTGSSDATMQAVLDVNSRLSEPLKESEIRRSLFRNKIFRR